jgi:hypothetical protein
VTPHPALQVLLQALLLRRRLLPMVMTAMVTAERVTAMVTAR